MEKAQTLTPKKQKNYEIDMCSGPILGKLLRFAIPLMFSSMLQLLFNAADIVVVGRFAGDNSLAAVGSNTALISLLTNLFVGLSIGANVLVARQYGAHDEEALGRTVHTAVLLGGLSGCMLTVFGLVLARDILLAMQTTPGVLDLAAVYLRIYFVGMPAVMLYNFGAAILRAVGDTRRPLYYLFFAGILNVGLNLFFVIVLQMDVAGVALATVISQTLSACLVLRCLLRERGALRLCPRLLRIDRHSFLQILRIGLPAGVQGALFSLSNVVIQASVNLFGETVVAGNTAAANIGDFVYFAMNAYHQATLCFTGQNVGAGRYDRVPRILLTGQLCVIAVGLALGNAAYLFGRPLLGIYSDSAAVVDAGMVRLGICCSTIALCGIMDVMVGSLRGMGYSILPMVVTLIGACGLRLAWIATVFQLPQYHVIQTVYLSYPISWTITAMIHLICFLFGYRHLRRQFEKRPLPGDE